MTKRILSAKTEPRENLFLNLIFNFGLPIMILRKGNDWVGDSLIQWLEVPTESKLVPSLLLGLALLFPFSYGIYDLLKRKKWNLFSISELSASYSLEESVLFQEDSKYVCDQGNCNTCYYWIDNAYNLTNKKPLVELLLYNPQIFDVEKIEKELKIEHQKCI